MAYAAALPPPAYTLDTNCTPPRETPSNCDQPANTGRRHSQPRKLVHMVLFSFEADTLEILLNEEAGLVDAFFLVECVRTHRGHRKPLVSYPQLASFTVHFSSDDAPKLHMRNVPTATSCLLNENDELTAK
eukprot:gene17626-20995_t